MKPFHEAEDTRMEWPEQVHQGMARRDGLTPKDFHYDRWPVFNVHLTHSVPGDPNFVTYYMAEFPAPPPQANQYVEVEPGTGEHGKDREYDKLADPVGLALSRCVFELRAEEDGEVLHRDARAHTDGKVQGGDAGSGGSRALWDRLAAPPGQDGPVVEVRLVAFPMFMWLAEDGGMQGQYAVGHRGYFKGQEVRSPVYRMQCRYDGTFLLDGEPRPEPAPPEPSEADIASREYGDRLMAAEKAERERLKREEEARLERERIELEERYAREDAEREKQRREEEARAEAERKRNERYVQRNTVDPPKRAILQNILDVHFSWIGSTDEDRIKVLRKYNGVGGEWAEAAQLIANANGWTL